MRYVLDASVALKWVLPEPDSAKALALRDKYRRAVHELLAPDVFPIELTHTLAKAERRRIITPTEGNLKLHDLLSTLPALIPYLPILPRAYAIASNARIGVYDCLYVALAEREGCEFVTADAKLVGNLKAQFTFIVPLGSLP